MRQIYFHANCYYELCEILIFCLCILGMEEQLDDIFNFIREKGGAANLKQIQRRFNASPDLKYMLEAYNSLFFISKIKENHWMVRAKVDVELCVSYLQGNCDGSCKSLHICKSFLLSAEKLCKQPCKNGFSHNIKDSHNEAVLYRYNLGDYDIELLRSSFPRLCDAFQESGKCDKSFCGYLHLCKFFVQGKCQKECQFATRVGLLKQDVHGLRSPHNLKVFSSFDLRERKREVLLANVLFHSEQSEVKKSNETVRTLTTTNLMRQASCSNEFIARKFSGTTGSRPPLIMCSFYLNGNCDKGNNCKRLHLCKEFLINFNKCPGSICQFGFSHNPFDENNAKITKSVWTETDPSRVISFLRESFPRLCKKYEKGDCTDENCQRLHICANFLFSICNSNCCCFSHNIIDEHNLSIFQKYNLHGVSKMTMAYILPNILTTKRPGNPVDTGRGVFTNLSKSSQTVSRKSLNKSSSLLSQVKGITKPSHIVGTESSVSDLAVEIFSNERSNSTEKLIKHHLKKSPSNKVSTYNELPGSFIFSISETSSSNEILASEPIKLKGNSDLGFSSTKPFDLNLISKSKEGAKKTNVEPSVQDVSSYILYNFDEGYCMANDVGFQLLFAEKSEEEILKWCKMQQRYFRLKFCENSNMKIYPCFVDVEPCSFYWKKAGCKKGKCGKFHICKRLMLGEIHNRNSCTQNHSFENETLKQLIKSNKLESLTDKQILLLLRNRFPFACPNYQTSSCAEGEKNCSMLHICQHFVTKKCTKADDICELNHQAALESKQAERISEEYHISQTRLLAVLLLKGTNQKIGATNFKGKFCLFLSIRKK